MFISAQVLPFSRQIGKLFTNLLKPKASESSPIFSFPEQLCSDSQLASTHASYLIPSHQLHLAHHVLTPPGLTWTTTDFLASTFALPAHMLDPPTR